MNRLFRALLLAGLAGGVAAVVLKQLRPAPFPPPRVPLPQAPTPVDADALTDDERELLVRELSAEV